MIISKLGRAALIAGTAALAAFAPLEFRPGAVTEPGGLAQVVQVSSACAQHGWCVPMPYFDCLTADIVIHDHFCTEGETCRELKP